MCDCSAIARAIDAGLGIVRHSQETHLAVAGSVGVPAGERLEQLHEPGPRGGGRSEGRCDGHGGGWGLFVGNVVVSL